MNDDLAYLHEHLPDFPEYGAEHDRNGSDMRVRAFVGKALTVVQERLGPGLGAETSGKLDTLIFKSQFSDNRYLKRLGHANLTAADLVALAREDRKLLEIARRLSGIAMPELDAVPRRAHGAVRGATPAPRGLASVSGRVA